jgi:Flp pilus assembly protein TadG
MKLRFAENRRRSPEAGMSAVEVVILAPLVIGFIMFLVALGVLVDARGSIQGAARDAARMGSLQRDPGSAEQAAQQAAAADGMDGTCTDGWTVSEIDPNTGNQSNAFDPGELYTVQIVCNVNLRSLDWFSFGTKTFVINATAPLDYFRRSTP